MAFLLTVSLLECADSRKLTVSKRIGLLLLVLSPSVMSASERLPPGSSVLEDRFFCPGKNTGVGSLSHVHINFLTQELNQGLLHCRQIFTS